MKIQKMIDYIDKNTSPYDNSIKIMFMLLLTACLMILKGDIIS